MLLVSCYELGRQPLGAALPAAFLSRAGFRPAVADLSLGPLPAAAVARASVVVISAPMHAALRLAVAALGEVRRINPRCAVVVHGLYAWLNRQLLLRLGAQAVLAGECEETLVDLCRALAGGARPRAVAVAPVLRRLDYPPPLRAGLPPLDRYARLEDGVHSRLVGAVEATRGCLHGCRHCPIPPVYGRRFFAIPRPRVLADVAQLVDAGAEHITFADPDFLNGPRHSLALAREIHARWPHLTFDVTARVSHLLRHRALLPELRAAGCLFVVSALESLSDRVLAILDKGHTPSDARALPGVLRAAGIHLRPTWLPFTPWTTLADYREILTFVRDAGLAGLVDPVQLTLRLLVPPGSWLAEHPEMAPHLGPLVEEDFAHTWRHPDPRMDALGARLAAIAEAGAGDPPEVTMARIFDEAGVRPPAAPPAPGPRLTEDWFC